MSHLLEKIRGYVHSGPYGNDLNNHAWWHWITNPIKSGYAEIRGEETSGNTWEQLNPYTGSIYGSSGETVDPEEEVLATTLEDFGITQEEWDEWNMEQQYSNYLATTLDEDEYYFDDYAEFYGYGTQDPLTGEVETYGEAAGLGNVDYGNMVGSDLYDLMRRFGLSPSETDDFMEDYSMYFTPYDPTKEEHVKEISALQEQQSRYKTGKDIKAIEEYKGITGLSDTYRADILTKEATSTAMADASAIRRNKDAAIYGEQKDWAEGFYDTVRDLAKMGAFDPDLDQGCPAGQVWDAQSETCVIFDLPYWDAESFDLWLKEQLGTMDEWHGGTGSNVPGGGPTGNSIIDGVICFFSPTC